MGKPKSNAASLVINEEFLDIISRLLKFFKGDIKKTRAWIIIGNPMFGGIPPLKLIVMGKGNKVLQFIENAEYENTPPEGMEIRDGKLQSIRVPREWTITYSNKNCEWYAAGEDSPEAKVAYEKVKVREVFVDTPETKNDAGTSEGKST